VAARKSEGRRHALVGLRLTERGIPREHYPVVSGGRVVGEVTSGMYSPLAAAGVALAYVEPALANEGDLAVDIRGKPVAAERMKPPFVRSRVKK
jgi:glycine cleavage system T protein (aminomethyltransferase)